MKSVLLLVFIASLAMSQLVIDQPRGDQFKNPQFLKTLNNYFGCKTWKDSICLECSNHFYFNQNGICCQVKPECKTFNQAVGICEQCYEGYTIQNNLCVLQNRSNPDSFGCKTWNNGKCVECSQRWYFNGNGVCQQISDNCRTWSTNGQCQTCYSGYFIQMNTCVRDTSQFQLNDPLCGQWKDRVCIKCAERAYFDQNGKCREVSRNCSTWDNLGGVCLSCYNGFVLNKGICTPSTDNGQSNDPLCKLWDWNNRKCLQCSEKSFMNSNGKCNSVSVLCKTSDMNGLCTSCYNGYNLTQGQCVVSSTSTDNVDPSCKVWDYTFHKCIKCAERFVMRPNGACNPVSNLCKTFSEINGLCTSCYAGYDLTQGDCALSNSNNGRPSDVGCKTWDWNKQVCLECSSRWVFNSKGLCTQVSDNCQSYDANGVCTGCYYGYSLSGNQCVASNNNVQPTDVGCKTWDWRKQVCLECSNRWVFDSKGVCTPIKDSCKSYDSNGACSACFAGYTLSQGQCVYSSSNTAPPSDLGCKTWDWNKQVCLECSSRWVFNSKGVCTQVSDNCKSFTLNGDCSACWTGYDFIQGACVRNTSQPLNVNCKTWDWNKQVCLECPNRFVFNSNRICVSVSDNCRTFDNSGFCTGCYNGYTLSQGQCVYSSSNTAPPSDLGCKTWDWNKQVCLECSSRWVFNSKGVCTQVSDNCAQFSSSVCTSCFNGYQLKNGACVVSNNLCKTVGSNGACSSCWNGYVLYQNNCTPISKLADIVLYYSACCPEKLAQLKAQGRI